MNNTVVRNQIDGKRPLDNLMSSRRRDKFAKAGLIYGQNVVHVEVATDKKFRRGDVVKIESNKVTGFTGSETADDNIVVGIVKLGNWQGDVNTYVDVLTDGIDYVFTTEAVSAGSKLCPADDETTPTPIKRFVRNAIGEDIPYWIALESAEEDTFVKVKFLTQGGGGGGAVRIAKVKSRSALRTYVVDIYSGWAEDYTLPAGKLIYEDMVMKTPMLNDLAPADQLPVGTTFNVTTQVFVEDDDENTYWVPIERVGLP